MLLPITIHSFILANPLRQFHFPQPAQLEAKKKEEARNVAKSWSYSSTKALQAVAVAGELRACIHARRARNQVKLKTVAALMVGWRMPELYSYHTNAATPSRASESLRYAFSPPVSSSWACAAGLRVCKLH
jgi:hypothetical protein